MAKLLYQGHGSFRLTTAAGAVVYIDPFAGEGYDRPADLILVTHQHHDHNAIDRMPHAKDCVIWQNADALAGGIYRTAEFFGMTVEAVEAYNKNHPKNACVGYLITVDGVLCYFAGDTSRTAQMARLAARAIDYAFLPTDGIYNMGLEEALDCARLIAARHSVPVHMAPGALFDSAKAAAFSLPGALILHPNEEIGL